MNDESTMKYFTKLLRIRNAMKSLQQISWTVSQMERRYDVDSISEKGAKEVIDAYLDYVPTLQKVLDELKDEKQKKSTT